MLQSTFRRNIARFVFSQHFEIAASSPIKIGENASDSIEALHLKCTGNLRFKFEVRNGITFSMA
jgi:hypothetical protein